MAARDTVPHSWSINTWPPGVYPHEPERARWLVRSNKDELLTRGCLARVGRELVIFGAKYVRWLESKAVNVPDFSNGCALARSERERRAARSMRAHATADAMPDKLREHVDKDGKPRDSR